MAEAKIIKKQQRIQQSNKQIFIWVAIASVIVGFASVGVYFLYNKIVFHTKVIQKQDETISHLDKSIKNIEDLRTEIYSLQSNQNLDALKKENEKAIQVIIDALPADPNTLALGASIEDVLLSGVSAVRLENINISEIDSEKIQQTGVLPFKMSLVANDANALREAITRIERSIRVIDFDRVTLERTNDNFSVNIDAHAYFEPAVEIKLGKETIRP